MGKTSITAEVDEEVAEALEKRAKKEMLTLRELVSDILRRSVLSYKGGKSEDEKIDDKFITYFSRKKTGKKSTDVKKKVPEEVKPFYSSMS